MSYIGASPNSAAFLTDQFSGNGSTTTFTLSTAPAGTTSILVSVSGVLQDPTTYSVVGTTLTLGGAAPTGTGNISVRYLGIPAAGVVTTAYRTVTEFTATAGQTTFTPPSYSVGFIAVYLNGARLGAADFTASNGTTIVLATGASVDDLVVTESFYISSVANAIPAIPGAATPYINDGDINAAKLASNSVVTAKVADANITQSKLASGVAGTGPAFSAYCSTTQTITGATNTKVAFNAENFDTNNCFDTTNYRFLPNVAGYYQINATVMLANTSSSLFVMIYKNGTVYSRGSFNIATSTSYPTATAHNVIYCNGSTDYIEIYTYFFNTNDTGGGPFGTTGYSSFTGAMVRGA